MSSQSSRLEHYLSSHRARAAKNSTLLFRAVSLLLLTFCLQYFLTYSFPSSPSLSTFSRDLRLPELDGRKKRGLLGDLGLSKIPFRFEMGGGFGLVLLWLVTIACCFGNRVALAFGVCILLPANLVSSALASQGDVRWLGMTKLLTLSWLAQFAGHPLADLSERPLLIVFRTSLRAVTLAPFLTFLEALLAMGWYPELRKKVELETPKKISEQARIRRDRWGEQE